MFAINSLIDTNVKIAKQFTAYITDETTRKRSEALIDAQAEWGKSVVTANKTAADFFATLVK